jgi:hypothetical protein
MKKNWLGAIAPIALAIAFSGAAGAEEMTAVFDAGFAAKTGNYDVGIYNGSVLANIPLATSDAVSYGIEANIAYHNIDNDGGDVYPGAKGGDVMNLGGSFYASTANGKYAATYGYHKFNGSFTQTIGLGGVWYVTPEFDFAVKGGGVAAPTSGGYAGAEAKWFILPNLAVSANATYMSTDPDTTFGGVQAEWQIAESVPVSIYGGYQRLKATGLYQGTADMLYFGVKLYTSAGSKPASLRDHQHASSAGFATQSPVYADQF